MAKSGLNRQDPFGLKRYGGDKLLEEFGRVIQQQLKGGEAQRYLLGIAGPPMSGAKDLANKVVACINAECESTNAAIAVHLDDFRKTGQHSQPDDDGTVDVLRCSPNVFDAEAFCQLILNIRDRAWGDYSFPLWDELKGEFASERRSLSLLHKIVVVECPYLLYNQMPWARIVANRLLHRIWYVDVDEKTLAEDYHQFYLNRWVTPAAAKNLVAVEALPISRLASSGKERADFIITPQLSSAGAS
jgi:pantothenate kinase